MNRLITNRCPVCDWHLVGYTGECPQCLADENKLLRERAEKVEAACAEMRACIESLRDWEWDMPDHLVSACDISLSDNCGQGWLSPEVGKVLVEALTKCLHHLRSVNDPLALQVTNTLALLERKP